MRTAICGLILLVVGTVYAQQRFGPDGRLLSPEETKKVLAEEAKQTEDVKAKLDAYVKAIEKGYPAQVSKSNDGFRREHLFGKITDAKLFENKQADKPYAAVVYFDTILEESKEHSTREAASVAEYSRKSKMAGRSSFVVTFHQMRNGSWVPHSLVDGYGYMASDRVNSNDGWWWFIKAAQAK